MKHCPNAIALLPMGAQLCLADGFAFSNWTPDSAESKSTAHYLRRKTRILPEEVYRPPQRWVSQTPPVLPQWSPMPKRKHQEVACGGWVVGGIVRLQFSSRPGSWSSLSRRLKLRVEHTEANANSTS